MGKALDLTGQRFGKVVALEKTDKRTNQGLVIWKCQCDCGNIFETAGSSLKSGNTQSCGCNNALRRLNNENSQKNIVPNGSRFGKLTVIEDLGYRPQVKGHQRRWYKCLCDCGNEKEVQGNLLKSGHVSSCGKCNFSSRGEYIIQKLLEEHGETFVYNSSFNELKEYCGRTLRFDFIIFNQDNIKCFIECDGRQHYSGPDTNFWSRTKDTLEDIQERDYIKNRFCLEHGYKLYRIPYWRLNNLTYDTLFNEEFLVKGE